MRIATNIVEKFKGKIKIILSFCCTLLLVACGGEDKTDCDTIQQDIDWKNLPLQSFFKILEDAGTDLSDKAWGIAEPLSYVVLIYAAIYIATRTFKAVHSFGKQSVSDFLTGEKDGILPFMFKATLIWYFLAKGKDAILKILIVPLLSSAAYISQKLSPSIFSNIDSITVTSSWKPIFNLLTNTARSVQGQLYFIVGIGDAITCNSTIGSVFSWDFLSLIYGVSLFVFGWMLLLGVTFFLFDIIIRLTFAAVLLPLGIACAVSKPTITYTKNVWNLFLNVFFSLIIFGIVLDLSLLIVLSCVGGAVGGAISLDGLQFNLPAAVDGNDVHMISSAMHKTKYLLLTVVAFCIIFQLVKTMGDLAEKISDTFGFSPTSQAMAPIAQKPHDKAKTILSHAGDNSVAAVQTVARKARLDKLYKWTQGTLTGTGSQGYRAWWRRR